MSGRPSIVPTWCTTGTRTAPNAAKIASGWGGGERPPAQIVNYLMGLAGDWCQYLYDGAFTGGISADSATVGVITTTGAYLHHAAAGRTVAVPVGQTTSTATCVALAGFAGVGIGGSGVVYIPIPGVAHGDRISTVTLNTSTASGSAVSFSLLASNPSTGALSAISSTVSATAGPLALAVSSPTVATAGVTYYLQVSPNGSTMSLWTMVVVADAP